MATVYLTCVCRDEKISAFFEVWYQNSLKMCPSGECMIQIPENISFWTPEFGGIWYEILRPIFQGPTVADPLMSHLTLNVE